MESPSDHTDALSHTLNRLDPLVNQKAEVVRVQDLRAYYSSRLAVSLPTEILADIFTLACFSPPWATNGERLVLFDRVARSVAFNRTYISLTCNRWREVAEGTNVLWRMVLLASEHEYPSEEDEDEDEDEDEENGIHFIQTSGHIDRPSCFRMHVDLFSRTPLDQTAVDLFAAMLPKAEYLYYNSEQYEPSDGINSLFYQPPVAFLWLRKLAVHLLDSTPHKLDLSCAPRLEQLTWSSDNHEDRLLLGVDCQVRNVALRADMNAIPILNTLQSCPLLETLCLGIYIPPNTLTDTLVFPSLRRLILYDHKDDNPTYIPLKLIQAPKLESLGLLFQGHDFRGPLVCPSLRYLAVIMNKCNKDPHQFLRSLFESCGPITTLALTIWDGEELTATWLHELLPLHNILPSLRYLETELFMLSNGKHLAILDLRPHITLVLPKHPASHSYLKTYPAYASLMKITEY